MSSQALTRQAPTELQEWKSPLQIKMRVDAIQQLMKDVLKPGTKDNEWSGDYGVIPGTGSKPSLWKSGSEQILAMFEIAVEPIVEDLSTDDCFRYRVTTRLTHAPTGNFLGAGIGEASTNETKYKWRRTYNEKEFKATPEDRRRIKYSQYKDSQGMWADKEEMQVRSEPADLANTILKMAKKRSQIDATLTVTGASSMFDQDLEDMTDEQKQSMRDNRKEKGGKKGKAESSVMCADCRAIGGHLPSCKYHPSKKATEQPVTANPSPAAATKAESQPQGSTEYEDMLLQVKDVQNWTKGNLSKVDLTVIDNDGNEWVLSCWHKSLFEELHKAKGQICAFSVSPKVKDGRTYYNLEKIITIGSIDYEDGKPISV